MAEMPFMSPIIIKEEEKEEGTEGSTTIIIKQEAAIKLEFETEEEYDVVNDFEVVNVVAGAASEMPSFSTNDPFSIEKIQLTKYQIITSKVRKLGAITKKKKTRKKISGYIMFSKEMRPVVAAQENQNESFGAISKIIGQLWRESDKETKDKYGQMANEYNIANKSKAGRKRKMKVQVPIREFSPNKCELSIINDPSFEPQPS